MYQEAEISKQNKVSIHRKLAIKVREKHIYIRQISRKRISNFGNRGLEAMGSKKK